MFAFYMNICISLIRPQGRNLLPIQIDFEYEKLHRKTPMSLPPLLKFIGSIFVAVFYSVTMISGWPLNRRSTVEEFAVLFRHLT